MEYRLHDCPFCGACEQQGNVYLRYSLSCSVYFVECAVCCACGPRYVDNADQARKSWNAYKEKIGM